MKFILASVIAVLAAGQSTSLRGTDDVLKPDFSTTTQRMQVLSESAYVFVAILFMYALKGLGHPESAMRGNLSGVIGTIVAIVFTMATPAFGTEYITALLTFSLAAVVGVGIARKAEMIMMPQMVAGFHAMVGLAAVLVAFARYFDVRETEIMNGSHLAETMIGVFFGAVTLTGSIVACGKLHGVIDSKPLILPARHALNAAILLGSVVMTAYFCAVPQGSFTGQMLILGETVVSMFLGWHLVMSIGGADMPVVVSMLNSYSGWTTVAAGFMLDNDVLIIAGSLIGSSGAILSYIMCVGMNRSFISVIAGGFGVAEGHTVETTGEAIETNVQEVVSEMINSKSIVIVPGYGMAVARCQQSVAGIAEALRSIGVKVRFAIHPVAGRLPGHMNVLLAEANVPYDIVEEMEKINPDLPTTDMSLVCGANDIVNPLACEDLSSPIGGMPVLEVWKAKRCVVMKRSLATGYAGVDNPLFYKDNSRMLFGNAKARTQEILSVLQAAVKDKAPAANGNSSSVTSALLANQPEIVPQKIKEYPAPKKTLGFYNECVDGETRVAISPNIVSKFRDMGYAIVMEKNAGNMASFPDRLYAVEGVKIVNSQEDVIAQSDVVVKISQLKESDIPKFRAGQIVVAYMWPGFNPELVKKLAAAKVTGLAVDSVPRITIAQKLDTLSSMANMAGYKAIVEAFHRLPRFSKPLTTAAGQVPAAKVFVIGAGVAGLSAIGTARSLGAIVKANDTRSVVQEQVESMGAEFIPVPYTEEGEGAGGYAKVMSAEFQRAQLQLYANLCKEVDVVVTTAQIPGKPAPKLITADVVRSMTPGSVIVDLAAQQGGNCELTKRDVIYTEEKSGVTIVGLTNMATTMPAQASELYSANLGHLFKHMGDACCLGKALSNPDNVIGPVRVSYNGEVTYQPPKAPVGPPPKAAGSKKDEKVEEVAVKKVESPAAKWAKFMIGTIFVGAVFFGLGASSDMNMMHHFLAFAMAVVVGYFLVWNVDHALHTPLMSVTNAISGIIVIGALLQLSAGSSFAVFCAVLGCFCASVNIFGGFTITHIMLQMFKK